MENLSLSVPDLLTTVKQFVGPEKHPQLDQMLQRYLQKELGKQQLQLELRTVAGRDALRQALLAMVPQIDELQRKRELMKKQQQQAAAVQAAARAQQEQTQSQMQQPPQVVPRPSSPMLAPLKADGANGMTIQQLPNGGQAAISGAATNAGVKLEVADGSAAAPPPIGCGGVKIEGCESVGADPANTAIPVGTASSASSSAACCQCSSQSAGAPSGSAGNPGLARAAKSTLPVQALVHAFHCQDSACQQKSCHETKQVLKRMETHVSHCPVRQKNAQSGQTAECKVCKLWQALHRTRSTPSGGGVQGQPNVAVTGARGEAMRSPARPSSGAQRPGVNAPVGRPGPNNQDQMRARLKQLDPAQVKRMLLQHVRSCQNKQCHTCHKLRERIKASRAAQQQGQLGGPGPHRPPSSFGSVGGQLQRMGSSGGLGGGMGDFSMQGSWNPLAGCSGFGQSPMDSCSGWGGCSSSGWCGSSGGPLSASGSFPHTVGNFNNHMQQAGGQRRKAKQRGRENIQPGLAVPSRHGGSGGSGAGEVAKFSKVVVKLKGVRRLERSQRQDKSGSAAASGTGAPGAPGDIAPSRKNSKSNKRAAREAEEIEAKAAQASKRVRRESSSRGQVQPEEEEEAAHAGVHQIKHAKDRSPELEQNPYEVGSHVEVQALDMPTEWRLAVVRSCNEQSQYTVQYEPVEQNRHKQTGVAHSSLRMACSHADCRRNALFLAALPLFCDRCRKALMSSPQQRVYFQETQESAEAAASPTCIRLCNTCYTSLKTELRSKGQNGLAAEVQKFTRELPQGSERQTLDLDRLEETPLPQRAEGSDAPVLSKDIDDRWVQCEVCHKWWHWMCGMYNDMQYKGNRPYYCVDCRRLEPMSDQIREAILNNDAENLTVIPMSAFIEKQVAVDLKAAQIICEPVTIRIVSSLLMTSYAPERLIEHQQALGADYPKEFPYKSKALLAFQKRDGIDVCLFALYVQEYGSDCPEPNKNRVYISYLDSVRYFESTPAGHRSTMYHAVLVAYLQWIRMLGFKYVHIWVEPPKMGDEYIFFARSDQQRKPMKRDKLREWYKAMLDKAKNKGVVESYGTMSEMFHAIKSIAEIPLFHGDQWEITVPSLLGLDVDHFDVKDKSKLVPMDSRDVVQKAQQEMQHLKRHFLVVVLHDPEGEPQKDEDPVISTDLTDSRQTFLGQCQMCHWQFNSLRHAKYSTMMILNQIHNKPSYCVEDCQRGRVEDGSFMVGCDVCDNWYHGDCVGISKDEANQMESYLCRRCYEKGEAAGSLDEFDASSAIA